MMGFDAVKWQSKSTSFQNTSEAWFCFRSVFFIYVSAESSCASKDGFCCCIDLRISHIRIRDFPDKRP